VEGGTVGKQPDLPRFFLMRNTLTTLVKDLPASMLLRSLPKILLYHYGQFMHGRREGFARTVWQAYLAFLRDFPGTLRKRRRVQRDRTMPPVSEFRSLVRTEYPLPTRLGRLLR
jgi:hypothetical protein